MNKKGIAIEYFINVPLAVIFFLFIAFLGYYIIEAPLKNANSHMIEVQTELSNDYILYNYLRTPVDGKQNMNFAELIDMAQYDEHDDSAWKILEEQTTIILNKAYGSRDWKFEVEYFGKEPKKINDIPKSANIYVSELKIPARKSQNLIKVRLSIPTGKFIEERIKEQTEKTKALYETKMK